MTRQPLKEPAVGGQEKTQSDQQSGIELDERRRGYGLSSIVGQRQAVERLRALLAFHAEHGRVPGHILLVGGDGIGKHTMARAFAAELGSRIVETEAPGLKSTGDITGVLTNLGDDDVLIFSSIGTVRRDAVKDR
jgi:Holliday junction resolvasome RuvABC ATP-dependent DNA helicase subunit